MTEFVSAPFYSTWEVYDCLYVTDRKSLFAEDTLAHVESSNDDKERGNERNPSVDCILRVEAGTDDKDSRDYIENVHDDGDDGSSVLEDSLALTVAGQEEELLDYDQTFCRSRSRTGLRISTTGDSVCGSVFFNLYISNRCLQKENIFRKNVYFEQKSHYKRMFMFIPKQVIISSP